MAFRYETHLHTCCGSACASASGAEMARAHKEAGYDGIFITDHFFNGNSAVPRDLPWAERIELFCRGYEEAKAEGDRIGLPVFFGLEYAARGAEFLIYNLDKAWLLAHPDIDRQEVREVLAMMRSDGGFVVQAHPFRERAYIHHIQLYPRDVDGVEGVNAAHTGAEGIRMNQRAMAYAQLYDLPVTSGSDSHHVHQLFGGGVETETPIETPVDYLHLMCSGKLRLLTGGTL